MPTVNLGGAGLQVLDSGLRQQAGVDELYLHENQLTELPEWLGELTELRILDLSHQPLKALPDLGRLQRLEFLYVSDLAITELPPTLGALTSLLYLGATDNGMTSVPESLGRLGNLIELRLYGNRLTELPESYGDLANLRELHLDRNAIDRLPATFDQLTELRILSLRANALTDFPVQLSRLPHLRHLDLRANHLTYLPDLPPNAFPALEKLDLRWLSLPAVPEWIHNLHDRGCAVYRTAV
ncbi:leucine-rich repeat domain-containing protein [Kribbella sp. CWNU-51]